MSIVMVRLGKPGTAGYTGIVGLLGTLLAKEVPGSEKRRVLTEEYGVALTDELEDGVAIMGTLGELLYEEAHEEGYADGHAEGLADGLEEGRALGRAEGREEGRAEGREEGRAEGLVSAWVQSVRNLALSAGMTLEDAADAIGIPEEFRCACLKRAVSGD